VRAWGVADPDADVLTSAPSQLATMVDAPKYYISAKLQSQPHLGAESLPPNPSLMYLSALARCNCLGVAADGVMMCTLLYISTEPLRTTINSGHLQPRSATPAVSQPRRDLGAVHSIIGEVRTEQWTLVWWWTALRHYNNRAALLADSGEA